MATPLEDQEPGFLTIAPPVRQSREQVLVDMIFEMAVRFAMGDYEFSSREEAARWVSKNLRTIGFNTTPAGMSWGVLIPAHEKWEEIT